MEEIPIPPVSGRHRNKALAAERRRRCVELILQGNSYQAVADHLGYANRGTVHRIVQQALAENAAASIDEQRQLELRRLDALQYALWDAALQGDLQAAHTVLRIIDRRSRVLGLYGAGAATTSTSEDYTILF